MSSGPGDPHSLKNGAQDDQAQERYRCLELVWATNYFDRFKWTVPVEIHGMNRDQNHTDHVVYANQGAASNQRESVNRENLFVTYVDMLIWGQSRACATGVIRPFRSVLPDGHQA